MKLLLSSLLVFVIVFSGFAFLASSSGPLVYGSLWFQNDSGETATVSAADEYFNLTIFQIGETATITNPDNNTMNITYAGVYKIDWSMSFSDGANQEFHGAVGVNGLEKQECHAARKLGPGGNIGNFGGTCLLSLSRGDLVTLMYENEGTTSDMIVTDASINIAIVGVVR